MTRNNLRSMIRLSILAASLVVATSLTACKKKTADDRLKEAEALLQERQIPLAMITLKDTIEQFPDDPATIDARFLLAQVYLQQGRKEFIQSALDQLKIVHEKLGVADPKGLSAYRGMIELTAQNDNLPGAIKLAQDGIELLKDNKEEALGMQFFAYQLQVSSTDEAVQKEGIAGLGKMMLENEDATARGTARESLAGYYRDKREFLASNEVYEKSIAKYPDDDVNPQLLMAEGLNFKAAKEEDKAKEFFDKGAAQMLAQVDKELNLNDRAQKLNSMAIFYGSFGDVENAEKQLRRIMSEQPATKAAIDAQFNIARLYIQNHKYDEADVLLQQIAKENANSPIAQSAEAWRAQLAQQRKAEATQGTDGATSATITQSAPAAVATP